MLVSSGIVVWTAWGKNSEYVIRMGKGHMKTPLGEAEHYFMMSLSGSISRGGTVAQCGKYPQLWPSVNLKKSMIQT